MEIYTDVTFKGESLNGLKVFNSGVLFCRYEDCDLSGAQFTKTTIQDTRFVNCRMTDAVFTNCRLTSSIFHGCDLDRCKIDSSVVRDVSFSYCSVPGMSFPSTKIIQMRFTETPMNEVYDLTDRSNDGTLEICHTYDQFKPQSWIK